MTVQVVRRVDLDRGHSLVVRHANATDVDAVQALYGRLSMQDLQRRFFTGAPPPRATVERWVLTKERSRGLCLIVEHVSDAQDRVVVAEAGFVQLPDGDAEMAITVDPEHRGWLGPWLFDVLLEEAAAREIPNLQALIAARNSRMILMVCNRGASSLPDHDWTNVRLQVSTTGDVPAWRNTDPSRRRLLVEGRTHQWTGTSVAKRLGFDVTVCAGPENRGRPCPLISARSCPLVDGADGVLVALAADQRSDLVAAHRRRDGAPFVVKEPSESSDEAIRRLSEKIDERNRATPPTHKAGRCRSDNEQPRCLYEPSDLA